MSRKPLPRTSHSPDHAPQSRPSDESRESDDESDGSHGSERSLRPINPSGNSQANFYTDHSETDDRSDPHFGYKFSHHHLDLKLRRNIINLAEATQEKPKPNFPTHNDGDTFVNWLEAAHVAISPSAEIILFASHSPEKLVFYAKLRMEPIDQYTTKTLEIPMDYDEYVTSLLCLPIMSTQRTSICAIDWTALVVGLSSGYVRFYTEQSICLLSLKFCDEPIVGLKCQTQKNNSNGRSQTHFASIVDELLVIHRSCAIMIDGIGLYENLRISKEDVVKSNSQFEPAYTLTNLPTILTCVKMKFDQFRETKILDADLFAMRSTTRFDSLKSDSINPDHIQAKTCTRTLATVGQDPFLTFYREAKETTTHSYTEIITSFFPIWNKPPPTKMQMNDLNQTSNTCIFDRGRLANSIVASPDKRLAAITDDFGRVMLVDVTNSIIVRLWKGYRSAQCGWIEVKRDLENNASPYASFLVIYAPKRGLLEIWSMQRGPRVAAFNVGRGCRILYSGYKMLNMRAESCVRGQSMTNPLIDQSYSTNCYLLNPKSGMLFTIELPYTYSLYKFGDLQSRDLLFIEELTSSLQQDEEVKIISETLHRIVLAESIKTSIEKIALNLAPEKIVHVMENLVNKIMKNYDNDSGEYMTDDDQSIVDLCKRLILLCSVFNDLSKSSPSDITFPDVNQRLIHEYEEHPQEIDDFAQQLNWTAAEVLRCLSLLALERSYRKEYQQNPWPNMGEPLTWSEFISCFEITAKSNQKRSGCVRSSKTSDKLSIRLKEFGSKFLNEDKIAKTAIFMFNRLSENFYKSSMNSKKLTSVELDSNLLNCYRYLEPSSRIVLLFHFWLSTKLCNYWKMWAFLQDQVGRMSDELKVISMEHPNGEEVLIDTWKQVYKLILESDNIFAAIIATATIRSDTLKAIRDDEKREKLERETDEDRPDDTNDESKSSAIDWECLCIDAERMSMLNQQLEDVFLLNLILRYSPKDGHLIDSYVYKVPRISVANVLRSGPSIVSELVAQWAAQSNINLATLKQPYGDNTDEADKVVITGPSDDSKVKRSSRLFKLKTFRGNRSGETSDTDEEQAKELLHHTKTSFPHSLEPNILLVNCIWEFCRRWSNGGTVTSAKSYFLNRTLESMSLLDDIKLKHSVASVVYKSFFQRTFERLAILVEANANLLSPKSLKNRDAIARRELNMSEDCLGDFVQFCCNLSEILLETCRDSGKSDTDADEDSDKHRAEELFESLSIQDDWWSTPMAVKMLRRPSNCGRLIGSSDVDSVDDLAHHSSSEIFLVENELGQPSNQISIVRDTLLGNSNNLLNVNTLVELNKLANLNNLIFKLKITRAYPLSLIGEESRQMLRFDLQQSPTTGADIRTRSGSLFELRQKFARKCVVGIVAEMADETSEITEAEYGFTLAGGLCSSLEDIDTGRTALTGATIGNRDNRKHANDELDNIGPGTSGKQELFGSTKQQHQQATTNATGRKIAASSAVQATSEQYVAGRNVSNDDSNMDYDDDDDDQETLWRHKSGESMLLFNNLLSLANEWHLDRDELYLELVFELYRCNLDKIAAQISTRVQDKQTLANGLLKIASQRVLVLFGLSPQISDPFHWRRRTDKWSLFQPNVASWLKGVQMEELKREIASLSLSELLKPTAPSGSASNHNADDPNGNFLQHIERALGVQLFGLNGLRLRTKLIFEEVTNYLDGQSGRLAYDLLQVLESKLFEDFLVQESKSFTSD